MQDENAAKRARRTPEPRLEAPVVVEGGFDTAERFSITRRKGAWRDALLRRMLALADLAAGVVAAAAVAASTSAVSVALWSALLAPVWLVVAKLTGLYDRDQRALRHLTVDETPRIATWALAGTSLLAVLLTLTPAHSLSAGEALRLGLVAGVSALVLRAVARVAWRRITPPEETVVIGTGALAQAARRKFELFPDMHGTIVDARDEVSTEELESRTTPLRTADRILLATPQIDEAVVAGLVAFCRRHQIKLSVVPPLRGVFGTAVQLNHVADLPVVEYNTWDVSRSTLLLKRLLDLALAGVALIILSPLLAAIACAVWVDSGRPVIFKQLRAGQNGEPFRMLKFRTMVADAESRLDELVQIDALESPMFKLRDDPRVTAFGRLLRRTSLDELPQLVNVLRGQMSLVGPRPEQVELVERYEEQHQFRLAVKPGMTGPMQVYGRGELTFDERLAVERDYIEGLSLSRDLRILGLTLASVFHGRGAF